MGIHCPAADDVQAKGSARGLFDSLFYLKMLCRWVKLLARENETHSVTELKAESGIRGVFS